MELKKYFAYILTNPRNTVLYIGVTNNLTRRIEQHQSKTVAGFATKYNLSLLVYYETFDDPLSAIEREKQLKRWSRMKKESLIHSFNPEWKDLCVELS